MQHSIKIENLINSEVRNELKETLDAEEWITARNWVRADVMADRIGPEPPEVIFPVVEWFGKIMDKIPKKGV
jgi:hypothetical protein